MAGPQAADEHNEEKRVPGPDNELARRHDVRSQAEAVALIEDRDLDQEKLVGDHERAEGLRGHFYRGCVAGLWVAMAAVLLMFCAYIYHVMAPASWHWLATEQVNQIKSMLFSGAVGGFIAQYFKKVL